jgi:hypothetical protein
MTEYKIWYDDATQECLAIPIDGGKVISANGRWVRAVERPDTGAMREALECISMKEPETDGYIMQSIAEEALSTPKPEGEQGGECPECGGTYGKVNGAVDEATTCLACGEPFRLNPSEGEQGGKVCYCAKVGSDGEIFAADIECEKGCHGTGRLNPSLVDQGGECPECDGTGKDWLENPGDPMYAVKCYECDGTGRLNPSKPEPVGEGMTFDEWWDNDGNHRSDMGPVRSIARHAWNAALSARQPAEQKPDDFMPGGGE